MLGERFSVAKGAVREVVPIRNLDGIWVSEKLHLYFCQIGSVLSLSYAASLERKLLWAWAVSYSFLALWGNDFSWDL